MPFRRILPDIPSVDPTLVTELANELRQESETGPDDAPYIEEVVSRNQHRQVTVIWDRWKDIDPQTRGRIIMDAYRDVLGEPALLSISIALGLTHDEARRLGIGSQP